MLAVGEREVPNKGQALNGSGQDEDDKPRVQESKYSSQRIPSNDRTSFWHQAHGRTMRNGRVSSKSGLGR